MIPRCNSCKFFCGKKETDNALLFTVIHGMEVHMFDGQCLLISMTRPETPFLLCLRRKNQTCEKWEWGGQKKKNESDLDQATVGE